MEELYGDIGTWGHGDMRTSGSFAPIFPMSPCPHVPMSLSKPIKVTRLEKQAPAGGEVIALAVDPVRILVGPFLVQRAVASVHNGAWPELVGPEEVGEHPRLLAVVPHDAADGQLFGELIRCPGIDDVDRVDALTG